MKHSIMITVNGFSFQAIAEVSHITNGRIVESVTCDTPPVQVLGELSESLADINDVCYLVQHWLNDTGRRKFSFELGPIEVSFSPIDPERFRQDLTGKTFMVKLLDNHRNTHLYDIGAESNFEAMDVCKETLDRPIWSSVVQPLEV